VRVDSGIVRGLDYYTGAVYEAQLTFPVANEDGETVVFGSVGGGGRYDDLIARFTGQSVPASGFSIGVSRLLSVLRAPARKCDRTPIVVLVLDKAAVARASSRPRFARRQFSRRSLCGRGGHEGAAQICRPAALRLPSSKAAMNAPAAK
jgi:histidyl-tRNA synthetase